MIVLQKRTNIVRNIKVWRFHVLRNIVDLNTTCIEDMTKRTEITTRSARVTTGGLTVLTLFLNADIIVIIHSKFFCNISRVVILAKTYQFSLLKNLSNPSFSRG